MELILFRKYHESGTNGKFMHGKNLICHAIELPWLQNRRNVSCIPEGRYQLTKRYTNERGEHLLIADVVNRDGIIIHPANDAIKELQGCIAPVTSLAGPGKGWHSGEALERLESIVFPVLDRDEVVFLTIKKEIDMNIIDRVKAPTPKFFKVLRNVGLALAAAGGAILASPIALPAGIITVGGYLVASGSVLSAVSQTTVEGNETNRP
ncbi:MAG: DUF5675 family protein [Cyclobacteriaceae bacterium]